MARPLIAGDDEYCYQALLICPVNAVFLQQVCLIYKGLYQKMKLVKHIRLGQLYSCTTFRHTHFDGKQGVVHNRLDTVHEILIQSISGSECKKRHLWHSAKTLKMINNKYSHQKVENNNLSKMIESWRLKC
ncbi:MAG: DUF4914 family protein [Clostridia bacterium]|nr:DUF4914 family protein [Clostridia bacterium]MBT7931816.1 DUF4914 family protein [Candidatus Woesearchaeota archaeon]